MGDCGVCKAVFVLWCLCGEKVEWESRIPRGVSHAVPLPSHSVSYRYVFEGVLANRRKRQIQLIRFFLFVEQIAILVCYGMFTRHEGFEPR